VNIIGRLGRDPELRRTKSGDAVCNFSVAVDDSYGERKHTEWFRVIAWKKTAENCAKYLAKGSEVFVTGRLQTQEYESKDGAKKSVELIAQTVQFLGGNDNKDAKPAAPAPDDSDSIPF